MSRKVRRSFCALEGDATLLVIASTDARELSVISLHENRRIEVTLIDDEIDELYRLLKARASIKTREE